MKILKKISFSAITLSLIILLSACSSGGSSNSGPLDLTGTWVGTITFVQTVETQSGSGGVMINNSGIFSVLVTIAQERALTLAGESNADFALQVTSPDGCVYILNAENAIVNGRTRSMRIVDGEAAFVAEVSNSSISGSANFGDEALVCGLVGGRIELRRG